MITLPGFLPHVFEITDQDFKVPEKEIPEDVESRTKRKPAGRYIAPSTSVLVSVEKAEIQLVIGKSVSKQTLDNVMRFGIKNKLPLKILRCEILNNLQEVDRMVVLCNSILEQTDTTFDLAKDSDV